MFVRTESVNRVTTYNAGTGRDVAVAFRIHADGVELLRSYIDDTRVINMSKDDVNLLTSQEGPKFAEFSASVQERLEHMGNHSS